MRCTDEADIQNRSLTISTLALPVIAPNQASYMEPRSSPLIGSIDKTVNCFPGIFIDLQEEVLCYVPWHLFGLLNHGRTLPSVKKKKKKKQDLTIVVRFIQSSLITSIPC